MSKFPQEFVINIFFSVMILLVILLFTFKELNKPVIIIDHIEEKWLIENLNEIIVQTPYGYKTYKYLKDSMVIIEQEKDIYENIRTIKLKVTTIR